MCEAIGLLFVAIPVAFACAKLRANMGDRQSQIAMNIATWSFKQALRRLK